MQELCYTVCMFQIFNNILPIIKIILLLICIVVIHESGHYIVCKFYNVKVLSVGLGLGPILYTTTDQSGTKWNIHAIPIAAYVEPDEIYNDQYKTTDSIKQFSIAAAGPIFNILLSIVCLYTLFSIRDIILYKHIINFNTYTVHTRLYSVDAYNDHTKRHALNLLYKHIAVHKHDQVLHKIKEADDKLKRQLDLERPDVLATRYSITVKITNTSIATKCRFIYQIIYIKTQQTFNSIYHLIAEKLKLSKNDEITKYPYQDFSIDNPLSDTVFANCTYNTLTHTPISVQDTLPLNTKSTFKNIIEIIKEYSEYPLTFASILYIIAILSLGLGIFNLLPIPGLDGYYMALSLLEIIFRRRFRNTLLHYLEYLSIIILTGFVFFKNVFNQQSILYKIFSQIAILWHKFF